MARPSQMRVRSRRSSLSATRAAGGSIDVYLRAAAHSDVGKKRKSNQDAYAIDDKLGLFVVADGMGGHAGGEVASQESVEIIHDVIKRDKKILDRLPRPLTQEAAHRVCRMMESAVQNSTYLVYSMAEQDRSKTGMGTTTSACLFVREHLILAQVGDSRVYRLRDGVLEQLTEDHTLVAWQVKRGLISPEEAKTSPHRNVITRAVGSHDYVEVDTDVFRVASGDRYLVCSDGLHGYLKRDIFLDYLALPVEDAAEKLVQYANDMGGKDNITAIVIEIG
jgi:serine/threonine protein phosphatase PrpC